MDLTTIEAIEDFLQVTIDTPTQIGSATRAIAEVNRSIRAYCRQQLSFVEEDSITLDCSGNSNRIFLPELPVTGVVSVIEDDTLLVAVTDYKLAADGVLYRIGQRWPRGIQNVTIVYSHGYATLPEIIFHVATRAASRAYQAGLIATENDGVLGIASKSLGDFSVSYQSGAGGGVGEGLTGASGASMLLSAERFYLDGYRYKGL